MDHFFLNAVGARSLLLLDGHSSHYQPQLIEFAKEHDIIIFCLPPHTTHESQPSDASVFKSLKQNWQELCDHYMKDNPGKVVTKYSFSGLLRQAWEKTMTPSTIMAGFRRGGVYPLNPDAIDCSISVSNPEATLESFGGDSGDNSEDEDGENNKENREQNELFQSRFAMTCQIQIIWSGFMIIIQTPFQKILYQILVTDKIPWQVIFHPLIHRCLKDMMDWWILSCLKLLWDSMAMIPFLL